MNGIKFNRGRGGLGRALDGKDHICGIVANFLIANLPAQITAEEDRYQVIYSLQDAEDLGIVFTEAQDNVHLDSLRYALERVFAVNGKAVVHLQIADQASETQSVATELITLQNKAQGEIRQALALDPSQAFDSAFLTNLQASCDQLEAEHKPLSVIYACDHDQDADFGTVDLRGLDNKNVSVIAGSDGNGKGDELRAAYNVSFTAGGTMLGALSIAKVNENIAWVGAFNVNKNDTNEFDVLKLADGRSYDTLSQSEKDALSAKGYVLLIKHIGVSGSYFNDSYTAISASDDFAYIENVRTIDKAVRGARTFLLPRLNSPLFVNEDGTLTEDTIASFKNDAERALEEMQRNEEVSAFKVTIDPDQDVLATSKVTIAMEVVPVGVARNIVVNIGLAVRVSN